MIIHSRHRGDVIHKESMGIEALMLLQGLYRIDDIVSGEGLAVIPGNALAQRDRRGRKICVICRVTLSKARMISPVAKSTDHNGSSAGSASRSPAISSQPTGSCCRVYRHAR